MSIRNVHYEMYAPRAQLRKGSLRPHYYYYYYYYYYYLHGGQRLKITSGGVDVPCIYLVPCKRLRTVRVRRSKYP